MNSILRGIRLEVKSCSNVVLDQLYVCVCVRVCAQSLQSCPTLCNPVDGSPPGSSVHGIALSMGFSRQENRSGLPCPPPGDPPDPGITPSPPVSPSVQVKSVPLSHWGSPDQ